eukprot:s49_g28.t1
MGVDSQEANIANIMNCPRPNVSAAFGDQTPPQLAVFLAMDEENVENLLSISQQNDDLPATSVKPRSFAPWKILVVTLSLVSMVVCASRAKVASRAAPGAVKETVELATWDDSIEKCTKIFQHIIDHDAGAVRMGEFEYDTQTFKVQTMKNATAAAKALQDPTTNFIQIGKCGFEEPSVVWLYPDKSGDEQSSFLLADGECKRLASSALGGKSKALCAAVYRIRSPAWGTAALNHFHAPGSISHAVVGGHGSDSAMKEGALLMSDMIVLTGVDCTESLTFVDTLGAKLTAHGTVFIDSCFAGINGVAELFSKRLMDKWVMGGVVELQSYIEVHHTPFSGAVDSGPTRVVSELAWDQVLDPSKGLKLEGERPEPEFVKGLVIEPKDGTLKADTSFYKLGERIIAWHGGINRGSVTQWLYPSSNGQALRIGCKVKVLTPFRAYRMETSGAKGHEALSVFPQMLPVDLEGTVTYLHAIGNSPTSGDALINYELPRIFEEVDVTGGAGQTLGVLVTLTSDFNNLHVTCPATKSECQP